MDFVFFVLLVGALVLVHELGHFMMARLFGVKVLTFSLGFGPTLLSFRGKETTYRIGLLPFGGFVRMLEDPSARGRSRDGKRERAAPSKRASDPRRGPPSSRRSHAGSAERPSRAEPLAADEIALEDRHRTFQAQSLGRRALIALAGPAMNVLVPLFLFFAVFLDPGKTPPAVIGVVVAGSPADGALLAGDRVESIDGHAIETYAEVQTAIAASPDRKLVFHVIRTLEEPSGKSHDESLDVTVTPRGVSEPREFGAVERTGRLGIGAAPLAAVVGVSDSSSPAYRAGLRTFDVITHVHGVPTPRFSDLARVLRDNVGVAVPINFLRPTVVSWPATNDGASALAEVAVYEAHVVLLAPEPVAAVTGPRVTDSFAWGDPLGDGLRRAGIETADLYVASVADGSSEWRAGLRTGDRVASLDGEAVRSWQAFTENLVAGADRTREVSWTREGKPMTGLLRVRKEEWIDAGGEHVERYVWRSTHWAPTVPPPMIDDPHPIWGALQSAVAETGSVVRFLVTGALRLVEGKMTMQAISGPITIYDVAGRAGARGARDFLWVMALISINLGLLNLLPIPTLDGGQLLFLTIEALTRRPIPLRVREVMSIAGLSMLLLLMAIALRNDVGRHWDALMGPVRQLFG